YRSEEARRRLRGEARRSDRSPPPSAHRRCSTLSRSRPSTVEQFAGVHDRRLRNLLAAEHACNLRDALFAVVELPDPCTRMSAPLFLPYEKVRRSEARDLRQMR